MTRLCLTAPVLALLLAACGGGDTPEEGNVSGEVLEGTISDAMLPLDRVQSRAPLAESTEGGTGPSTAEGGETTGGNAEAEDADEEAADEAAPAEAAD